MYQQIEIDQNGERYKLTGNLIGDRELQIQRQNNSLLAIKNLTNDGKTHRVDIYIVQEEGGEEIEGVDTTGSVPYRSFTVSYIGYTPQFISEGGFVETLTLFIAAEIQE